MQAILIRQIGAAVLALALLGAGAAEAKRSAADQAFYEKAKKACQSSSYPPGTRPIINYKDRWYRCQEPKSYRSNR